MSRRPPVGDDKPVGSSRLPDLDVEVHACDRPLMSATSSASVRRVVGEVYACWARSLAARAAPQRERRDLDLHSQLPMNAA